MIAQGGVGIKGGLERRAAWGCGSMGIMRAFNVVTSVQLCSVCGEQVELRVAFKYGDVWQYEYRLGDKLGWGGNQRGKPGARKVVVDGANEACPRCGASPDDNYEVWLEGDAI